MNVKAMLQLVRDLVVTPYYNQTEWATCGTPACIGGHACARDLGPGDRMNGGAILRKNGKLDSVEPTARRLLGLDLDTARRLFSGNPAEPLLEAFRWPEPFARAWQSTRIGAEADVARTLQKGLAILYLLTLVEEDLNKAKKEHAARAQSLRDAAEASIAAMPVPTHPWS